MNVKNHIKAKILMLSFVSIAVLGSVRCGNSHRHYEPHAIQIVSNILNARNTVIKNLTDGKQSAGEIRTRFITIWDFDGTIIKGDCTEGLVENNKTLYRGLAETAIERGLSRQYGPREFNKFKDEYYGLLKKNRQSEAYASVVCIFAGTRLDELVVLSEGHFKLILQNYYFSASMYIIETLKMNDIDIFIISASPSFFVRGASKTAGVEADKIFGIETAVINGRITGDIKKPVTFRAGKTERIEMILSTLKKSRNTEFIYVLAGFGNSFNTDGHFLSWISGQKLPGGARPLAVMVNGGESPAEYSGKFLTVTQCLLWN